MFADTGQAVFDQSTFKYFYRITPPDDAVGYAMAVYAHKKGYPAAAGRVRQRHQLAGIAPTVVSGFQKLGGKIVVVQKIPLDQSSYRTEVSALIAHIRGDLHRGRSADERDLPRRGEATLAPGPVHRHQRDQHSRHG